MKEYKLSVWIWRQIYKVMSKKFDIDVEFSSGGSGGVVASTIRIKPIKQKLFVDYDNKKVILKCKN